MRRACVAAVDATAAAVPKTRRRRRDHLAARYPRQPRPLRRKPRSPARRPALPRLRRKLSSTTRIVSPASRAPNTPSRRNSTNRITSTTLRRFSTARRSHGILATPLPVDIPPEARTSHHWIVAGTGAGKTTALQYFIAKDLERAARGECSLVILDSQRQLVEDLWGLKLFAPGQPLDGKLCILDAADIEYPIALNLFDMHLDRLATLSPLDRERLTNSALEMYDFIIGSLLQAEMTSRQSTLFHFVTRALFAIPEATIHTFHDILKNGTGQIPAFHRHPRTRPSATSSPPTSTPIAQFKQTREQVNARLLAVLGNKTFLQDVFEPAVEDRSLRPRSIRRARSSSSTPRRDCSKTKARSSSAASFSRLINQAAAQRTSIPKDKRLPCYVYVDECHNYIKNDPKIQVILAEARQQKVGVILAHQFLSQIDPPVRAALNANTGIKMAARLDAGDRTAMARDMNTVPDFIRDQTVGSFAVFIRDPTPTLLSMRFPEKPLARFTHMRADEQAIVRDYCRERYARYVPFSDDKPEPPHKPDAPPPAERQAAACAIPKISSNTRLARLTATLRGIARQAETGRNKQILAM